MAVWVWAVAYAVGFVLIQLLVYYYYARREGGSARPAGAREVPATGAAPAPEVEPPSVDHDDDVRRCPHCGAPNEIAPQYSYCRHCAGQL